MRSLSSRIFRHLIPIYAQFSGLWKYIKVRGRLPSDLEG